MQLNINTYGTYLHVKDDMFEVRIKKDHDVEKHHYSSKKVTSLILALGTAISSDAVKLAIINNIDIIFVEYDGMPLGRVWHCKLGSTTKIRKAQLEASMNDLGVKYIKEWISIKVQNQIDFIKDLKKHRTNLNEYLDNKIEKIENLNISICNLTGNMINDMAEQIRGLEGTAGRLYFETMSYVLPKDNQFQGRSNRPAKDPFNAFLNYSYGILYSKIEKSLIIAGLDPYLGFLHRDDYNQLSFVYDFIEPYRIYADKVVFRLFTGKKVNKNHTEEITNGFSLNKSGKELLIPAFNNYFDEETIRYRGRNITRSAGIQSDAHHFANSLIGKSENIEP
jgi:CRISP-associated protein Cas1